MAAFTLLGGIPDMLGLLPPIAYKYWALLCSLVTARILWNLSDSGWFSVPIFFIQLCLIWALLYWIVASPNLLEFALIYNRFYDLIFFFIIGTSIYRIRALKKRAIEQERIIKAHTIPNPINPANLGT